MDDLIEALKIFRKYIKEDIRNPTNCCHDVFLVCSDIGENDISPEDVERLKELSFSWSDEYDSWSSYRFGSC